MSEFIQKRPLVVFFTLVMVNMFLLSVQIRNQEGRILLRSLGLLIFSPLASALHFTTESIENVAQRYLLLYGAREENRRLRAENSLLQVELAQLRSMQSALSRIRPYHLARDQYLFDTLLASIIRKGAPFHSRRVWLSVGTRHGVEKDSAVITPSGLVGRVWATSPFSAEVELITNAGAAAGAMLNDSRLQGVIQGDGSDILRWNFIPNFETVAVGAMVHTSGNDRIYPKGLPIGRVIRSEKTKMAYREILVEPFVDCYRLEEALVVTSDPLFLLPGDPRTPSAADSGREK